MIDCIEFANIGPWVSHWPVEFAKSKSRSPFEAQTTRPFARGEIRCSGTGVDVRLEFRDTAEPFATIRREGRKKGVSGNAAETLFRSLAISQFDALTPVSSIKTIRRQTGEMQALAVLIVQLEVERSM